MYNNEMEKIVAALADQRRKLYRWNVGVAMAIALSLVLLAGCGICSEEEVLRKASPDGRMDAVMIEQNCGATTGFVYRIFVISRGDKVSGKARLVADHTSNLDMIWKNPHLLVISYDKANIHRFKNHWYSDDDSSRSWCEVRLRAEGNTQ